MISKATGDFWEALRHLPRDIQQQAREKFRLWQQDPFHPSLHFKELTPGLLRINLNYRAQARRRGELITWFWIGTHEEYQRLIGS